MSSGQENPIIKYFKDFSVLKETRKEYWGLQLINMLDCIAYFAIFHTVTICLTEDFGFTDVGAGYTFTLFASSTTIFLFFSGVFSDWLGIKRAIYTSMIGMLILRGIMMFAPFMPASTTRNVIAVVALFLMAPFMAMIQTVFQAANKRFTTKRSRGAGFNLWYLFMNVGSASAGILVDVNYLHLHLPRHYIFGVGVITGTLCVLFNFLMIKNTEQLKSPNGEEESDEEENRSQAPKLTPMQIIKAVISRNTFWRFTALVTLLLGVRAVFLYLGLLHPKFWLRVIGPDARIGSLQALNPILVIIGLVVLIPILNRFSVYKMLITGAIITSLSMFILAIPPFGGYDVGQFTYATTIAFLLLLTLGELIWSPRLQEYTASIAPEGQEGTYLGLSMVPYFLAKTLVSLLSGHMLNQWCPEGIGERIRAGNVAFVDSPYMMWTVLGSVALIGSITAYLLKDWFNQDVKVKK